MSGYAFPTNIIDEEELYSTLSLGVSVFGFCISKVQCMVQKKGEKLLPKTECTISSVVD